MLGSLPGFAQELSTGSELMGELLHLQAPSHVKFTCVKIELSAGRDFGPAARLACSASVRLAGRPASRSAGSPDAN